MSPSTASPWCITFYYQIDTENQIFEYHKLHSMILSQYQSFVLGETKLIPQTKLQRKLPNEVIKVTLA